MSSSRPTHRKPYRVTKQREKWTEEEHNLFLEAVEAHGRNWKEIVEHVGTRSVAQVRSHAQKHFLKLEKAGHPEAVPPARPKKPAARPYPVQDRNSGARSKKRDASCLQDWRLQPGHAALSAPDAVTTPCQTPRGSRSKRTSHSTGGMDTPSCGAVTECEDKEGTGEEASGEALSSCCQDNSGLSTADVNCVLQGMAPTQPIHLPPQGQDFLGGDAMDESAAPDYSAIHHVVGSFFDKQRQPAAQQNLVQQLNPAQRECLAQMMGQLQGALQESSIAVPHELQPLTASVPAPVSRQSRTAYSGPPTPPATLADCLSSFPGADCGGELEPLPLSSPDDDDLLEAFQLPLWDLPAAEDVLVPIAPSPRPLSPAVKSM